MNNNIETEKNGSRKSFVREIRRFVLGKIMPDEFLPTEKEFKKAVSMDIETKKKLLEKKADKYLILLQKTLTELSTLKGRE